MKVLGIESSCDETAVSVLECNENNISVLSNIVATQIEIHARFGGVVPEIASRAHCEAISKTTYEALDKANVTMEDIDVIAVTSNPGLIGALLVGVSFAKSLSYTYKKPLVAVNHIKGHIASNYIDNPSLKPPFIALTVSGGHTSISICDDYSSILEIGGTRDDAIGETFDKIARVMGMPYPGGKALDKLAYEGKPTIKLPSAALRDDTLDFSFSGIKTAVLNYLNSSNQKGEKVNYADVAKSFVDTAVDSIVKKLDKATEQYPDIKTLVVAGGVSANSHLREALKVFASQKGINLHMPKLEFCGDNGAMIAASGYYEFLNGKVSDSSLNASAFFE